MPACIILEEKQGIKWRQFGAKRAHIHCLWNASIRMTLLKELNIRFIFIFLHFYDVKELKYHLILIRLVPPLVCMIVTLCQYLITIS